MNHWFGYACSFILGIWGSSVMVWWFVRNLAHQGILLKVIKKKESKK